MLEDIRAVQKLFPGKKSNSELAELLTTKKPFKDKYQRLTDFPGFRKVMARALNPKLNPNVLEGEDWIAFRAEKAAKEFGLPTELGIATQMATLERLVMENMRQYFLEKHKTLRSLSRRNGKASPGARGACQVRSSAYSGDLTLGKDRS